MISLSDMLDCFFAFLPALVAAVGFVFFLSIKERGFSRSFFTLLIGMVALYYVCDGFYMLKDLENHKVLLIADILLDFLTPALPVLTLVYIRSLFKDVADTISVIIYLIPAAVIGTGAVIIFSVMGMDQSLEYFRCVDEGTLGEADNPLYYLARFWTFSLYMYVLIAEVLVVIIYLIAESSTYDVCFKGLCRFLFKGGRFPLTKTIWWAIMFFLLICCVKISFGGGYLYEHRYLSWVMSSLISLSMAVGIWLACRPRPGSYTLSELLSGRYNITPDPSRLIAGDISDEEVGILTINKLSVDIDAERIYNLLMKDGYYNRSDASVEDAAQRLGLSKRRINSVVMIRCLCLFDELLSYCRDSLYNE